MSTMKRGLLIVLALALTGTGDSLLAQRGRGGVGLGLNGLGPRLGENIELALDHRSDLGLTTDQVTSLQELQAGIQRDVAPLAAQIDDLRAEVWAGEVDQLQGVTALQDLLAEYQVAADPYRLGVSSILTAEQHAALQRMMFATRAPAGLGYGAAYLGGGAALAPGSTLGLGLGRGTRLGGAVGLGRGAGLGYNTRLGLGRGIGLAGGAGMAVGRGLGPGRGLRRRMIRSPGQFY